MRTGSFNDLDVVLTSETWAFESLRAAVEEDIAAIKQVSRELADIGTRFPVLGLANDEPDDASVPATEQASQPASASRFSWERVRADAVAHLQQLGIEQTVPIEDLLDKETIARIERLFVHELDLRVKLDKYDVAVAIAAGLVAGAIDFLLVRIPIKHLYEGNFEQVGSPLTAIIRGKQMPGQEWLEKIYKASFDAVNLPDEVSGFGSRTHRMLTFGHDPLFGLIFGTIDIMRGGLSAIDSRGNLFYFKTGITDAVPNPLAALAIEIGHLLSDASTSMGLPPPGWAFTQALQFGSFGRDGKSVADLARFMYSKGYDSRHFMTMATSVAAAEVVSRGYFCMRRYLDEEYEELVTAETAYTGHDSISHHVRFIGIATIAHMVACGVNAGKIAVYQGNPLALNYAQWLRFAQCALAWQQAKLQQPSAVLRRHIARQLDYLVTRLPVELFEDHEFPGLLVGIAPSAPRGV